MDIRHISRGRYLHTVWWGLIASGIIVMVAAGLGRASMNLKSALTDKPDIAIYILLEDEEVGHTELLRETEDERHYLAETKDGPMHVILKKGETEWYVSSKEPLRE